MAVAASTAVVAATSAGAGTAAAVGAAGCTPYTALIAPGTWETTATADPNVGVGMLKPVGDGLKSKFGDKITVLYVPYAASAFDQGLSYAQSVKTLTTKIDSMLSELCASTQVVMAGYSQGADGIGDVASAIGNNRGKIPANRVLGVGLLSDPKRDPSTTHQIGGQQAGHGIAGVRKDGFGSLTTKVRTICGEGDLYCSVSDGAQPFISAIGQTLSGNVDGASEAGQLSSSMVSDFSKGDLGGINSTLSTLTGRANSLSDSDLGSSGGATGVAGVGSGAQSVIGTLTPLQDLQEFVKTNTGAAEALKSAPSGSPESSAATILDAVSKIDIGGAISSATSLANSAQQILAGTGGGPGSTSTASPKSTLAPQVEQLASQTSALSGLDSSTLSSGMSILKLLKPNTIIKQITNVGTGVFSTAANVPAILDSFAKLPGAIATGDIQGAHKLSGDINNLFSPVIKMAAGVDLSLIASIVSAASVFDPSGAASIASLIIGVLANLDIVRIANDVGQIQEVLWAAVDKLSRGDLLGAGAAMTGLVPVGIDLAAAVAGMFTGGEKTDVSELGKPGAVAKQSSTFATAVNAGDLGSLAGALTQIAGSDDVEDIVSAVGQGLDVATFYASGAHVNYSGGVQQLLTFLSGQIR